MPSTNIKIKSDVVTAIADLLSGADPCQDKNGAVLTSFIGIFSDKWVAEISLVSGGSASVPFIDPILFGNGGSDIYFLKTDRKTVIGIYRWAVGDRSYTVTVEAE